MLDSSRDLRILLLSVSLAALAAGRPTSGWQAVRLGSDAVFSGIWFTDSLNGWISGGAWDVAGGFLGRTRDGGRTWTIRSNVVKGMHKGFYLRQIQFRDSLRGFLVSDSGLVLRTQDGGTKWRRAHSMGYGTLSHLQLLGEHGWALGPAAWIGTGDGGETWHKLVPDQNGFAFSGRAAVFTDAMHGWLLGHSCELMRSKNGGRDWTLVSLPTDLRKAYIDVTFVDAMNGWLVGERGAICHTRDGGVTWELQTSGVPVDRVLSRQERNRASSGEAIEPVARLVLNAVRFADAERGFAVGTYANAGESVILGTRNGGTTWTTEKTVPGQMLFSLFVLDRRHAWATGAPVRPGAPTLYRYTAAD